MVFPRSGRGVQRVAARRVLDVPAPPPSALPHLPAAGGASPRVPGPRTRGDGPSRRPSPPPRELQMKTVMVASTKGGTAKTTSASGISGEGSSWGRQHGGSYGLTPYDPHPLREDNHF